LSEKKIQSFGYLILPSIVAQIFMFIVHLTFNQNIFADIYLLSIRTTSVEGSLFITTIFTIKRNGLSLGTKKKDLQVSMAFLIAVVSFVTLIITFSIVNFLAELNIAMRKTILIGETSIAKPSIELIIVTTIVSIGIHSIVEELYFRFTLIESLLKQGYSSKWVIRFQAFLFMLWHWYFGILLGWPFTLVMGYLLGLLYIKTRTLENTIISHAFLNLFLVVTMIVMTLQP